VAKIKPVMIGLQGTKAQLELRGICQSMKFKEELSKQAMEGQNLGQGLIFYISDGSSFQVLYFSTSGRNLNLLVPELEVGGVFWLSLQAGAYTD
jgi:hypothetical protein